MAKCNRLTPLPFKGLTIRTCKLKNSATGTNANCVKNKTMSGKSHANYKLCRLKYKSRVEASGHTVGVSGRVLDRVL